MILPIGNGENTALRSVQTRYSKLPWLSVDITPKVHA